MSVSVDNLYVIQILYIYMVWFSIYMIWMVHYFKIFLVIKYVSHMLSLSFFKYKAKYYMNLQTP